MSWWNRSLMMVTWYWGANDLIKCLLCVKLLLFISYSSSDTRIRLHYNKLPVSTVPVICISLTAESTTVQKDSKDSGLLECSVVMLGLWFPTWQMTLLFFHSLTVEGTTVLRNVGNDWPSKMASRPRRHEPSETPLSDFQISQYKKLNTKLYHDIQCLLNIFPSHTSYLFSAAFRGFTKCKFQHRFLLL